MAITYRKDIDIPRGERRSARKTAAMTTPTGIRIETVLRGGFVRDSVSDESTLWGERSGEDDDILIDKSEPGVFCIEAVCRRVRFGR